MGIWVKDQDLGRGVCVRSFSWSWEGKGGWGFGFRALGFGFRVVCFVFRVHQNLHGSAFRVPRVTATGHIETERACRERSGPRNAPPGFGSRASCFVSRVSSFGFRVWGSVSRVPGRCRRSTGSDSRAPRFVFLGIRVPFLVPGILVFLVFRVFRVSYLGFFVSCFEFCPIFRVFVPYFEFCV